MYTTNFLSAIRSSPHLQNTPIVMAIEGAPADAATSLKALMGDPYNVLFLQEIANNTKVGVPKTNYLTEQMRFCLERRLAHKSLVYSSQCVYMTSLKTSRMPRQAERDTEKSHLKDTLYRQLCNFRFVPLTEAGHAADKVVADKYKISGKMGLEQDDLGVAFQMSLYWEQVFMTSLCNPLYHQFKGLIGS